MTPKEKAEDLVKSFVFEKTEEPAIAYVIVKRAKECALITVDEILKQFEFNSSPTAQGLTEYYSEVKQEIYKL